MPIYSPSCLRRYRYQDVLDLLQPLPYYYESVQAVEEGNSQSNVYMFMPCLTRSISANLSSFFCRNRNKGCKQLQLFVKIINACYCNLFTLIRIWWLTLSLHINMHEFINPSTPKDFFFRDSALGKCFDMYNTNIYIYIQLYMSHPALPAKHFFC